MLFNSIIYIFLFLPIVTAAFRLSDRGRSRVLARVLLILATLLFYAAAGLKLVPILIISMLFNYGAGVLIERTARRRRAQYFLVIIAVCVDLAALGYFKYTNFLIENWDIIARSSNSFARIALPLGISFYTFQQIGYLVDVKRGKTTAGGPLSYANFVLFFPQLLAGPIVQRNELAPQFEGEARRDAGPDVLVGLTIFSIGLFKKTVVADTAALYATPVYHAAQIGGPLGLVDSWLGLFAYTAQIYFDFSGYSDMAIGSARMLGILLPINFHSPLRSGTTLEFWRRWHITLGRWVLAYIFQPVALAMARLAANLRAGRWGTLLLAVVAPTMVTMLVLGVWHGAGWNFAVFGLMQGLYMSVNEAWALFRRKARKARKSRSPVWSHPLAVFGTLIAFIFSTIPFGASNPTAMARLFGAAFGFGGSFSAQQGWPLGLAGAVGVLAPIYASIFLVPNTQQIMAHYEPALDWKRWVGDAGQSALRWRATLACAVFTGAVFFVGFVCITRGATNFVYFNF
jgi:alginate O-acetyltransferase complex protein AlgI